MFKVVYMTEEHSGLIAYEALDKDVLKTRLNNNEEVFKCFKAMPEEKLSV